VTIALAGFGIGDILMGVAAFCSVSIYLMFMFTAGHKDGETERKLLARKTIEKTEPGKWLKIGIIVWILVCLPCVALLIFHGSFIYLTFFRFMFSVMMALSLLFGSESNPFWTPFLFMGIYALTPVACRLGYYVGFFEKMTIDSIVYKKKKN
jgi:hypothetical protein